MLPISDFPTHTFYRSLVNIKSTAYVKKSLSPLLCDYYALLGMKLEPTLTAQKMLRLSKELPEFDDAQFFGEAEIVSRYNNLHVQLESLRDEERDIRLRIDRVSSTSEVGGKFTSMLRQVKQQTDCKRLIIPPRKGSGDLVRGPRRI